MSTVGENVARFRELRGYSNAELARLSGWDRPNLQRLQENKGGWSEDSLRRLAEALDVTPAQLVDDKGWRHALPPDMIAVPVMSLNYVSHWGVSPSSPDFTEGPFVITARIRDQNLFAVKIEDEHNAPEFTRGDVVICVQGLWPLPGDFAVYECDGVGVLRQYRQEEEASQGFALRPLNQVYLSYRGHSSSRQHLGTMIEHRRYRKPSSE